MKDLNASQPLPPCAWCKAPTQVFDPDCIFEGLCHACAAHLVELEDAGEEYCGACGCSSNHACAGGCSWVVPYWRPGDVCSRCVA